MLLINNISIKKILAIPLLFIASYSFASHIMGGEITWECLSNGYYKFHVNLYKDCSGNGNYQDSDKITIFNYPLKGDFNQFNIKKTFSREISPVCNPSGPSITCNTNKPLKGAVEEYFFESDSILLSGIPPPEGWIITWVGSTRDTNNAVNPSQNVIIDPSKTGITLRAKILPYNNLTEDKCFDSSPTFLEEPLNIICTGNPYQYNMNAYDKDNDSLVYSWGKPLDAFSGNTYTEVPLIYNNPYSFDKPFTDPNAPAIISPSSGTITLNKNNTQGYFLSVVKVESFRNGILISEVYREIQLIFKNCSKNNPPVVTPPFPYPATNPKSFIDTVYAGELVQFDIKGQDSDSTNSIPQNISIYASGSQFGNNFTDDINGCNNPPCATLTPPPPAINPSVTGTKFRWQTTCDHISKNIKGDFVPTSYNFVFNIQDDYCPVPARTISSVKIVVLPKPILIAPKLTCISTDTSNQIILNWVPPVDTNNSFNSYLIYFSKDNQGPFKLIDSIFNYNTTGYTYKSLKSKKDTAYFYIITRSACYNNFLSQPSDTLHNIILNVSNSNPGKAGLSWTQGNFDSYSPMYKIYREYPSGIWTLADSTINTNFNDIISVCKADINYQIKYYLPNGCFSTSNTDGKLFQDLIGPDKPQIKAPTVDSTDGKVILIWKPNSAKDTKSYIVYHFDKINNITIQNPIDTLYGINDTIYKDPKSNPGKASEKYCIIAKDSCGHPSEENGNQAFSATVNTIYLSDSINVCNEQNTLKWSGFINMPGGLAGYEIWYSDNNSPYKILSTLLSDTIYNHTTIEQGHTYKYFIKAFNPGYTETSMSNIISVKADLPSSPKFLYIKQATVTQDNQVKLVIYVDSVAHVKYYRIYRTDATTNKYKVIGTIVSQKKSILIFTDTKAKADKQSYYYKAESYDSCGFLAQTSNIVHTIYLEAEAVSNWTNTIKWNNFEGWSGETGKYQIFRSIDGVFDINPIATINPSYDNNNYTDDISGLLKGEGKFCYYVKAIEGTGNIYNFTDSSYSNIGCAEQSAKIYVPNAFVPQGINSIFKPVTVYVDKVDYLFIILNRWGQQVFQSTNPDIGWDGKINGKPASIGVYMYYIKIKNSKEEYFEKRGTVTLVDGVNW
ncbi:MAG: gliding motility-associated C-terminal domain-containing protein [Bacteroidota bacterium]|nr:gliding motility-associated C-terminal domain-containing protein [Bacteroidota bacterium]